MREFKRKSAKCKRRLSFERTLKLHRPGRSAERQESRIPEVYDFALALELGVSTDTGTAFVELGLSRISASTISTLFPSSNMFVPQAREALKTLDVETNKLSSIIVAEFHRLGLLAPAEQVV